ncbi:M4 family metallopeptidase [Rhodococcoides yunnanense]|uniref:M4 family metallopeptidase n=1 Tax=Rhodococcoides yunnanense TaxID=278209 RepID=UPI000A03AFFD|nr:M4 family metallopeptidase [Rhodococcus yunnanensis]
MPARTADSDRTPPAHRIRPVVPPFLLERIAAGTDVGGRGVAIDHAASSAARTLQVDREFADGRRRSNEFTAPRAVPGRKALRRSIFDAESSRDLPGVLVRRESEAPSGDVAVDEAYSGLGVTFEFFEKVYGRSSLDGRGLPLDATVHYDRDYDNAFWDGERMVFGDGDGEVFDRFTVSISVIAHELAHGFTQFSSQLNYSGQAGALNESLSDVFGVLVEQYSLGQTAEVASWLVGEGLFLPAVEGRALRSMLEPGTAYDDDVLGKDPQPADMDGYVETRSDYGGVHINSGIPNRAFAVTARALPGPAWDRAGQVWFDVATGGALRPDATFEDFASTTVAAAAARYGDESDVRRAVVQGWATVGITVGDSDVPVGQAAGGTGPVGDVAAAATQRT